ncbi:hypothetical protein AB0N60_38980 [Streptomyces microflavus]|uniref:hypothetical protein n=1 Tax=Streptomyces microflavus TaxID=1919 RepID=UPI003428D6CF
MITKRKSKAIVGIAAVAVALGALSSSPAQAATSCNSGRLCWYQPNGNITNVDVSNLFHCGDVRTYPGAIGNNKVRNRSSLSVSLYYDYNGDGNVTLSERVAYLNTDQSATLNPNSRYYYCVTL